MNSTSPARGLCNNSIHLVRKARHSVSGTLPKSQPARANSKESTFPKTTRIEKIRSATYELKRDRWQMVILVLAVLIVVAVKLQNTAWGAFGTEDESANYMRGLYILQHGTLPAFEPMQIPLIPIVAPEGAALVSAILTLVFQHNAQYVSLAGAIIGGLVFPLLFFAGKHLLDDEEHKNALGLAAVGLAVLSPELIFRMQLLVGETLGFVLLLIAIRFYAKGDYTTSAVLIFLIGFCEEFSDLVFILIVLLAGLLAAFLMRDKRRLLWSLVIFLVGLVPEGVLFFSQGPSYRISFVSSGIFPYPNAIANLETMIENLGVLLPLLGFLGFALCLSDIIRGKITVARIVLLSWFVVVIFYALYPPILPGVSLIRLMDYVTLPLALMGAYSMGRLLSSKNYFLMLDVAVIIIAAIIPSDTIFPGLTLTNFATSLEGLLANLPGLALALMVTAVAWTSILLLFYKSFSKTKYRRAIIAAVLLVLLSSSFMEASSNSAVEVNFYSGYLSSSELNTLSNFSSTIPHDSIIATTFVLGPLVAAETGRTVKDLPPALANLTTTLSAIENDSLYSEQFGPSGIAPPQLRVPIASGAPIYLVLVTGGNSILYTSSAVIDQLTQSADFHLISTDGRMYVFSVST